MTMLATALAAVLTSALAGASTAAHAVPQETRLHRTAAAPVHVGTYDFDTHRFEATQSPPEGALATGTGGFVVDFDNSATNGFTFLPGAGVGVLDWGVYTPRGTGTLHSFTIGYSTASATPIAITVRLYAGTLGGCSGTGTLLGTFPLGGLPASDGITPVAHTVTVTTRKSGIVVPAGPIGWEYRFFDVKSGPLLTNGPLGLPAPNGTQDAYDRIDLAFGGCTTTNFGGCLPPFLPCASFYLRLVADDGSITANVQPYGTGLNPPGSALVLAGTGAIGTTLVLGLTNPLGTQAPGSFAVLFLSFAPDPAFPNGFPIPFWGMSGPGAPSELLLALPWALDIGPSIWAGPTFPSAFPVPIPQNTNLIGLDVFFQGVLWDPFATFGVDFALTNGLHLVIGP
jgi:hypothetical protein